MQYKELRQLTLKTTNLVFHQCDQNVTNMKYREPFTIFPRKLNSGKTVYYYRTYTPDGVRSVAHSTGKTTKTQAKCYCADLLAKGLLYSNLGISFGVYAKRFFDDDSQWMKDKIQTGNGKAQPIAKSTLVGYRHNLDKYVIPFFKNIKLSEIKPTHIKKFREQFIQQGQSNSLININCSILRIIIYYARSEGLISTNPFISVSRMYTNAKSKGSFTKEQLIQAFHKEWETEDRKIFSLVAAVTGMRISEIAAIRKETLFDNYIDVKDQFLNLDLQPVKDGEKRKLRICNEIHDMLADCIKRNGNFAFTKSQNTYRNALYERTGLISIKARKELKLSFHSLRHFVNTTLITAGIPEIKVKTVLGHSSGKGSMSERYANFRPEDFDDVAEIQSKLINEFLI